MEEKVELLGDAEGVLDRDLLDELLEVGEGEADVEGV